MLDIYNLGADSNVEWTTEHTTDVHWCQQQRWRLLSHKKNRRRLRYCLDWLAVIKLCFRLLISGIFTPLQTKKQTLRPLVRK
jgi:hypothetical protein